jgi:putative transposase
LTGVAGLSEDKSHSLSPASGFVPTTDSNHDGPIFSDLVRDRVVDGPNQVWVVDGPNQVWVADISYIAIAVGFVYMAAILDAWSRRVVGYGRVGSRRGPDFE